MAETKLCEACGSAASQYSVDEGGQFYDVCPSCYNDWCEARRD